MIILTASGKNDQTEKKNNAWDGKMSNISLITWNKCKNKTFWWKSDNIFEVTLEERLKEFLWEGGIFVKQRKYHLKNYEQIQHLFDLFV